MKNREQYFHTGIIQGSVSALQMFRPQTIWALILSVVQLYWGLVEQSAIMESQA